MTKSGTLDIQSNLNILNPYPYVIPPAEYFDVMIYEKVDKNEIFINYDVTRLGGGSNICTRAQHIYTRLGKSAKSAKCGQSYISGS